MKDLSERTSCMVKYVGYFLTLEKVSHFSKQKYAYIVMECAEMNLQNFISMKQVDDARLSKDEIFAIIDFLLDAFAELEEKKIAHCDIKPENILILDKKKMKMRVCDVGSCKVLNSETFEDATIFGTVPFLAPEILRMKSKKMTSQNPFISDVYSFGLVILYIITFKKFTTIERREIREEAYFEIITEWIREARELTDQDSRISEVLRYSLEFDEFKRPLFREVKKFYETEKKKKYNNLNTRLKKLEGEESEKKLKYTETMENTIYQSVPNNNNRLNLFRSKNLTKISTRTSGNGFPKLNKNSSKDPSPRSKGSPSPLSKRQYSCFSSSPNDKISNTTAVLDFKKIIYVTE